MSDPNPPPPTEPLDLTHVDGGDDPVNQPKHYSLNPHGVECIEAIRASMTKEQYIGGCKKDVIKYLWRMDNKGKREQDVDKALWYCLRLVEAVKDLPLKSLQVK